MKTNGTLITRKLWLTAFVLLLMVTALKAQTSGADFSFINHSLISGSDRLAGSASLSIADNNGRIVKRQTISAQQGFNSTVINSLDQVPAGQYVVVVNGAGYSYTQKILIAK